MMVVELQLPFSVCFNLWCEGCVVLLHFGMVLYRYQCPVFFKIHLFLQFYLNNSIRYNTFVIFFSQTNAM